MTAFSVPEPEWQEYLAKAAPLAAAVGTTVVAGGA